VIIKKTFEDTPNSIAGKLEKPEKSEPARKKKKNGSSFIVC